MEWLYQEIVLREKSLLEWTDLDVGIDEGKLKGLWIMISDYKKMIWRDTYVLSYILPIKMNPAEYLRGKLLTLLV